MLLPPVIQNADILVWAVSEAKAGTLTQCLGVATRFNANPTEKVVVKERRLKRIFAKPIFNSAERGPDLIVSCGSRPEEHVLRIDRAYKKKPFKVHLQRPKVHGYDLCFVSRHDWTPDLTDRAEYHPVVGVPHRITADRLAHLRDDARDRYAPNGERVAAIFVGGSNGAYVYDAASLRNISKTILLLAEQDWKVLVSTSRRSDQATLDALLHIRSNKIEVWDRSGNNPYLGYVAAADAFLIAKDSITMPCEALATGKPVYSLNLSHIPGPRLEKFEGFHRDLEWELNLTRSFQDELKAYPYVALNETDRIASIVANAIAVKDGSQVT